MDPKHNNNKGLNCIYLFLIEYAGPDAGVKVFRIIPEFRILRLTFHRSQPQNAELGRLQ